MLFRSLIGLRDSSVTAIAGAVAGPTRIALSPRGGVAALYDASSGTIQVLTGLPENPSAAGAVAAPASVETLAVSDDGVVLAAACEGERCGLWAAGVLIGTFGRISHLSFLPGRRDAVATDAASGQVLLVRDVTGAAEVTVLASIEGALDRKSTRLNSSHIQKSRMPSSA